MEDLMLAVVAQRYYRDDVSKVQIAQEVGVSRFRVARMLEQARDRGIVRIEIVAPPEVSLELSGSLADRYGLRRALVLDGGATEEETRILLGRACTTLLAERLGPTDVLGVSWGRTLHALVETLEVLPACEVVQMVGSVPAVELGLNSMDLVRRIGGATGGAVSALHAPMVLESVELADGLRRSDFIEATTSRFDDISCAVVGIGAWDADGSSLRSALPGDVAGRAIAAGAAADICSTVVDDAGVPIDPAIIADRCVSISTEQLKAIPEVIAVAGGADKVRAIAAVARARLVHTLITDRAAAELLLGDGPTTPAGES